MEKRTNFVDFIDKIQRQDRYIKELEEENKKLKEENEEQHKTIESLYDNVKYFNHRLCDIDSKLIFKQEENKKLKSDLEECKCSMHFENDEVWYRKRECKKLKAELKETKETLDHRDSFFSIMRDVLANETITNNEIAMIVYCVVHEECWDYDLSEKELEVVKKFWNREYV